MSFIALSRKKGGFIATIFLEDMVKLRKHFHQNILGSHGLVVRALFLGQQVLGLNSVKIVNFDRKVI